MEIIRENLNIDSIPFMNALKSVEGITGKAYDSELKKLTLNVFDSWTRQGELDGLISQYNLDNFAFIISPNVTKFDSSELQKKIKKQSLLKNKLIAIDYNYKTFELKFKFNKPFGPDEISALDNIVDNLVGYDVITQLMVSYQQKEKDGHTYYNLKRSELVESIITAVRTEAEAFEIDQHLIRVKESLLTGDWKTAKTYLELTVVEGAYTQALKDEYSLEIQDYINANY
jgi:hypothetical protein